MTTERKRPFTRVAIELPDDLHAVLKAMAKDRDTTLSKLARHYLRVGYAADIERARIERISEFL
ncbi:hypothetical protein [Paraburkholderia oxyphila]|uniref:hypothetical protein n=1 Tax=Paraburkholderia oxyphila TaxID=614212 RepID=UPI000489CA7D|nr:hypothetical protein [Paraburkholderia oxyphila]